MVPGNRVQVVGIYSIKKMSEKGGKKSDKITAGKWLLGYLTVAC